MRRCAALLLAALLAVSASGRELLEEGFATGASKILNGRDAPKGRYPFIGQLRILNLTSTPRPLKAQWGSFRGCACVLIAPNMVLTTAECAVRVNNYPEVRLNAWQTQGGKYESRKVVSVVRQPSGYPFDHWALAVMQLDRPSSIKPVRLPDGSSPLAGATGEKLGIAGWGAVSTEPTSSYALAGNLKEASLLLLPRRLCARKWPFVPSGWRDDAFICAAFSGHNKALCWGDSGAPLLRRGLSAAQDVLVGIGEETQCKGSGQEGGSIFINVAWNRRWIQQGMAVLAGRAQADTAHIVMRMGR